MMIKTVGGDYINVDHVRELSAQWDDSHKYYLAQFEFSDGTTRSAYVYKGTWDDFEEENLHGPIIAAEPGYSLLTYYSEVDEVDRWPVLAWRIDPVMEFHQAVTLWTRFGEMEDDSSTSAILLPNGRVVRPGSSSWDTEDAWLAEQRAKPKTTKIKA